MEKEWGAQVARCVFDHQPICETFSPYAGTGYYFSRYRPGIGVRITSLSSAPCTHCAYPQTVLIFLALLTSLLQNVVHRLNHKREVERVHRFMLLARKAAWGPKLVKNDAPRKVRVNIAGNPYIDGEEQEYVQGRMIDMLVQGNEVYLVSTCLPKPPRHRILRPRIRWQVIVIISGRVLSSC